MIFLNSDLIAKGDAGLLFKIFSVSVNYYMVFYLCFMLVLTEHERVLKNYFFRAAVIILPAIFFIKP